VSDSFQSNPVAKGPVPYCLDLMSTLPNARRLLEELRGAIESAGAAEFSDLVSVFDKYLFLPTNFDAEKRKSAISTLQKNWFDQKSPDAFFPSLQPIAPIYAAGVLKTIELSLNGRPAPLPIDAWWLLGYAEVEMINLVTARQVTLLIATPFPPLVIKKMLLPDHTEVWISGRGISTRKL
jgi:hypothetical protein